MAPASNDVGGSCPLDVVPRDATVFKVLLSCLKFASKLRGEDQILFGDWVQPDAPPTWFGNVSNFDEQICTCKI